VDFELCTDEKRERGDVRRSIWGIRGKRKRNENPCRRTNSEAEYSLKYNKQLQYLEKNEQKKEEHGRSKIK
jgi:hypothetical protein